VLNSVALLKELEHITNGIGIGIVSRGIGLLQVARNFDLDFDFDF
jgi:hypothetical protein